MTLPVNTIVAKEFDLRGAFRFHEEFAVAVELLNKGLRRREAADLGDAVLPRRRTRLRAGRRPLAGDEGAARLRVSGYASGMDTTLEGLQAWVGRSETVHDQIGATPVQALDATLDHPAAAGGAGHGAAAAVALAVLPAAAPAERDRRRRPRPARRLPAAGAAAAPHVGRQPVRVPRAAARGRHAWRARSTIADVAVKDGRTGPLVFVKVRHELRCNGAAEPALVEFHDIVYREAPQPGRRRAAAAGRADRRRLAARDRARRRAAVPLLGADLQRPPHPLRPHAT